MLQMRFERLGGPETITEVELPDPLPGPGEVRIDVRAISCNFADILIGQGKYQFKPELPFAPGSEVAGTVRDVGEGVDDLEPGTAVVAMLPFGGYASVVVAARARVHAVPDGMAMEQAAALGVAYQTAYLGLVERGHLARGETLLVHAAAGGVGLAAVQVGKALGARVIATASSDEKLALARRHGADEGINYRDDGWQTRVLSLTDGRGADVVYDPVGGETFHLSTKCIAFDGRIVIIGFASGTIPEVKLNRVMLKNIAITGLHIHAYREHAPGKLRASMDALLAMHARGDIEVAISARYPLRQAADALQALSSRATVGKLILEP